MKRVHWLAAILSCMLAVIFALIFVAHTYGLAPKIAGRVLEHGKPAPDVPVRLIYVYPGSSKSLTRNTVTDANGRFTLGPIEEFHWFSVPFGDPGLNWRLELNYRNRELTGWRSDGLGFPPDSLAATCELDSTEHANTSIEYFFGQGICDFSATK